MYIKLLLEEDYNFLSLNLIEIRINFYIILVYL